MPGPLARSAAPLLALALLFPSPAPAQMPAGAEATAARLLSRVGPQTRNWIRQEGAREHAAGAASEAAARRAVTSSPSLGKLSGGDVEALVFLVLMEAAKSAHDDQKAMMDQMKQVNAAKAALRQKAQQTRKDKTELARNTQRDARAPQGMAARPSPALQRSAIQPRPLPKSEFDRKLQSVKDDHDSLSEMGDTESLRMQMAMDRMSKLDATLSNLLKKFSDTSSGITQNLK